MLSLEEIAPEIVDVIEAREEAGELDVDPTALLTYFRPQDLTNRPNTISVLREGKRKFYEVDEDIYEALTYLDEARALDIPGWGILNKLSRTLRAGATTAPEFLLRNPVRDQFMAYVQSEYGYVPFLDLAKGIFEITRQGPAYRKWMAAGGMNSSLYGLDLDGANQTVKELMGEFDSKKLSPFHWLRVMSALMEEGTRVAEFANALKKSAGTETAVRASREISTDFARHGAKTAAIRGISTFWNARVQGYDRLYRAMKKNPARFWAKVTTGIVVPSLIEYALNRDDEEYWELPQWRRDYFWNFRLGDTLVPIPKPFELGLVFGTGVTRMLGLAFGPDDERGQEELNRFLLEGLLTESEGIVPFPAGFTPLLENMTNYSLFLDRPIVPRSQEQLEPALQRSPFSSDVAVVIGEQLNYSPRKIDNIIYGYGAGVARMVTDLTDPLLRTSAERGTGPEPAWNASDIPGVRALVNRDPGFGSESVQEFYRRYDRAQTVKRTVDHYRELGQEEQAEEYLTPEREELIGQLTGLRRIASDLSSMRSEVEAVQRNPDLSAAEKRERIEALNRMALNVARGAVGKPPLENREQE